MKCNKIRHHFLSDDREKLQKSCHLPLSSSRKARLLLLRKLLLVAFPLSSQLVSTIVLTAVVRSTKLVANRQNNNLAETFFMGPGNLYVVVEKELPVLHYPVVHYFSHIIALMPLSVYNLSSHTMENHNHQFCSDRGLSPVGLRSFGWKQAKQKLKLDREFVYSCCSAFIVVVTLE